MKVLAILADGVEELEAVAVIDVLRRLGFSVVAAGLHTREVHAANGCTLLADTLLADCADESFDAVFLPGGGPGSEKLRNSETVLALLRRIDAAGGVVSAICAAPAALAKAGLLTGKRFTMYPGFESMLDGLSPSGAAAETDGRIVTGRGPGAVFTFAAHLALALGKSTEEISALYARMFVTI